MTLEAHMTESDVSKQVDHILQDTHSCEIRHRQSPSQRDEGWNERRVDCWFAPGIDLVVEEFEVLQVLEQPNDISKSWKIPHNLVIEALPRQGLITGYNEL